MKGATPQDARASRRSRCFNSRSREGSDTLYVEYVSIYLSFNSRSREGSDKDALLAEERPPTVSIHAPVKGATGDTTDNDDTRSVSIHAPVKGATYMGMDWITVSRVSIHAPVKGAT